MAEEEVVYEAAEKAEAAVTLEAATAAAAVKAPAVATECASCFCFEWLYYLVLTWVVLTGDLLHKSAYPMVATASPQNCNNNLRV